MEDQVSHIPQTPDATVAQSQPSSTPSPFPPPPGQRPPLPPLVSPPSIAPSPTPVQPAQPRSIIESAIAAFDAMKARMPVPAAPPPAMRRMEPIGFAEDYLLRQGFAQDIADRAANAGLRTGFVALDQIQYFNPGFYVIGAIPSLGKTTFATQMADQIAAKGRPVLYFCLEQTKLDYFSRSLARSFFKTHLKEAYVNARQQGLQDKYALYFHSSFSSYPAPSGIAIQQGYAAKNHPKELAYEIDRYVKTVGNRVCVIQSDFNVTVEQVRYVTELYIQTFGVKPVVFVDYLQILEPTKENGRTPDTKAAVDHISGELKRMYLEIGVTVIAISSLNRQNYLAPIAFESFKESGGIEFTADVMWGLQLSIMNCKGFYNIIDKNGNEGKETSLTYKRKLVKNAKEMSPRRIQLACIKNRFGVSSYEVEFLYFPANDYFQAVFSPYKETFPLQIIDGEIVPPDPPPLPPSSSGGPGAPDLAAGEQNPLDELDAIAAAGNDDK